MRTTISAAWIDERKAQGQRERDAGRRMTTINMMEGVIEHLCRDYKLDKNYMKLDTSADDLRQWTITLTLPLADAAAVYTENLWEFPTQEMIATMMLVSGK